MRAKTILTVAFAVFGGILSDVPAQIPADPQAGATSLAKKLPQLVDLGATKCIPCKMMAPILEDLKKEYRGRMDVDFIDVWSNPEKGKEYRVRMIPTQIFFNAEGMEVFRHEGFFAREDILAKWKEVGVVLGSK